MATALGRATSRQARPREPAFDPNSSSPLPALPGLLRPSCPPGGAPAVGVEVTAEFEFDVPARFDTDPMAVAFETCRLRRWQPTPIIARRT